MGFLLFAVRKLFLRRKSNDLSFRSIMLSQKKQEITEQINSVMQGISQAKSAAAFTAGQMQSIFAKQQNSEMSSIFEDFNANSKKHEFYEAFNGLTDQKEKTAWLKEHQTALTDLGWSSSDNNLDAWEKVKAELSETDNTRMTALQQAQMEQNTKIAMATQLTNNVFESMSNASLPYLNAEDSRISLEMANIESQLKAVNGELEGVEKAETEAAKSEAPKFGLG
ncbi:MAG TPA: hypothetical protein PKI94_02185 [Candidatus Gastranaerophilaceae bacterium]|nr:hypothetical protein [Candidatus Gastranaerophilaceae bacterium]